MTTLGSFHQILWGAAGHETEQDCACSAGEEHIWSSAPSGVCAEDDCACATEGYIGSSTLLGVRAEDDCACAGPFLSPAALFAPESRDWRITPVLYRASLPDAHELVFNPTGPTSVVVLNKSARAILDAYHQPHTLTDDIAHQLAALHLLTPIQNQKSEIQSQPSMLTAWLHVTNACNLRCAYCYLDKTGEAMTEDVGRAAVEAVFRSAQVNSFRAIKLKYAGGEPTLNFGLVQAIHAYALQKAAKAGLELREVVLSNGVALAQAVLDWLRDEQVRLMISLDGVGKMHDAQRAFINGRGTFALVARSLDRALERGLTPHLSITITARNADRLPEAVAFAIERDLPFNLNFYRENDCAASAADLAADHTRLIAGIKDAFAVIEANLPRRRLIDALVDRSAFDAPHQHPCGAGRNYLVIDQRGGVARCQMEIERPVTDVLAEDPLAAIRARTQDFQNAPVDEKDCRECTWRYWCAGGCPLLTFRATGRNDVKSPYCNVYRALYPDVLKLEGLRLLKWGGPAG